MYNATIKTKYNTINMKVEDINSQEFQEICEQPYIIEVRIEHIKSEIERLTKERDEALRHVVGTSYYNQVAQEKNKQILELKKGI